MRKLLSLLSILLFQLVSYSETIIAVSYHSGNGTVEDPYQIENLSQLRRLSETTADWDKHFILISDIDATDTKTWNISGSDTLGFIPIGDDASGTRGKIPFKGTFNGNGYSISNIFIRQTSKDYIGFFGGTLNAIITNLTLANINISGKDNIGGLVGKDSGSDIKDVIIKGKISASYYVGGLAGATYLSDIYRCGIEADISGVSYIGGLIGKCNYGTIVQCFTNCNIKGTSSWAAGLVSYNSSSNISNCYAAGKISGIISNVGGLMGSQYDETMTNCYSFASISECTGNLIGGFSYNKYNLPKYCYFDSIAAGTPKGLGVSTNLNVENQLEAKNTLDFATETTFRNWDFENTWKIGTLPQIDVNPRPYFQWQLFDHEVKVIIDKSYKGAIEGVGYYNRGDLIQLKAVPNYGYRFKSWIFKGDTIGANSLLSFELNEQYMPYAGMKTLEMEAVFELDFQFAGGDGSNLSPYQIATFDQLRYLSQIPSLLDKHFILTANINAAESRKLNITATDTIGFMSIGAIEYYETKKEAPFTGSFDGNGYSIDSLYIKEKNGYFTGFFSFINTGVLRNVILTNASITGNTYQGNTGILIGRLQSEIVNCYTSGLVEGTTVGGIAGSCFIGGSIKMCASTATIVSRYSAGGITAYLVDGNIENCYYMGSITGSSDIGGIVGSEYSSANKSKIKNCYALPQFISGSSIGTLAGYIRQSQWENCFQSSKTTYKPIGNSSAFSFPKYTDAEFGIESNFTNWDFTSVWHITKNENIDTVQRPYLQWQAEDARQIIGLSNSLEAGKIVGSGIYKVGDEIVLTARPALGYKIIGWYYDNKLISTDSTITITVPETPSSMGNWNYTYSVVFAINYELSGGDGSKENPYLIKTFGDLFNISQYDFLWDKHFLQIADIDAGQSKNLLAVANGYPSGFKPIAYNSLFTGSYNGGGFTISNLYISGNIYDNLGLFSIADSKAEIMNVNLKKVTINGRNKLGAIAGTYNGHTIQNCSVEGTITGTSKNIGGIIGNFNGSVLKKCNVKVTVSGVDSVGGIVGVFRGDTIANCHAKSTVTGTKNIGGICGYVVCKSLYSVTVDSTSITGDNKYGGMFGEGKIDTVKNLKLKVQLGGNQYSGALAGYISFSNISDVIYETTATSGSSMGGLLGFAVDSKIVNCLGTVNLKGTTYIGGAIGSSTRCYEVGIKISGKITGTNSLGGIIGSKSEYFVSKSSSNCIISGKERIGSIFGYGYNSHTRNCYGMGELTGTNYVGGLIGNLYRTKLDTAFVNSYFSGQIHANETTGKVGGLIGKYGEVNDTYYRAHTVLSSYYNLQIAPVRGYHGFSGASTTWKLNTLNFGDKSKFPGWDFNAIWAMGVEDTTHEYQRPLLRNEYSVIVQKDVNWNGKLIGTGIYSVGDTVKLSAFPDSTRIFIGWKLGNDTVSTDASYSFVYKGNGTLVFSTITKIVHPIKGDGSEKNPYQVPDYKTLRYISFTPEIWNKHFIQTNNINASESATEDWYEEFQMGKGFLPIGDLSTGTRFRVPFTGTYNGQGFTISNITLIGENTGLFGYTSSATLKNITLTNLSGNGNVYNSSKVAGLVSYANNSTIDNCSVSGNLVSLSNYGTELGLIAGYAYNSKILNCYANGTIVGIRKLGGIIGNAYYTTIDNCSFSGSINPTTTPRLSGTPPDISEGDGIGGIVGMSNTSTVKMCKSNITIGDGVARLGGIIGLNYYSTVSKCVAKGSITGYDRMGGIVGVNYNGNVLESYAMVNINGASSVGGIVGLNTYYSDVTDCYFYGKLTTALIAGGTSYGNYIYSTIENSYVYAQLFDNNRINANFAGGIVLGQYSDKSYVRNVKYDSNRNNGYKETVTTGITPLAYDAVGLTTLDFADEANFEGWDFDKVWQIGIDSSLDVTPRPYFKWQLNDFQVILKTTKPYAGTLSGEGYYMVGENITLTANPNFGYVFAGWVYRGDTLSKNTTYSFTLSYPDKVDKFRNIEACYQPQFEFAGGDGTELNPYQIATLQHLKYLSSVVEVWDKHFIQIADIDAQDTKNWNVKDGIFQGFSPIGDDSYGVRQKKPFTGSYNGQNYSITNLFINRVKEAYIGLFGYANEATLSNIRLTNVDISGFRQTGGLIGEILSRTNYNLGKSAIMNCFVSGKISANDIVGGIVGELFLSKIYQCGVEAAVQAVNTAGGIVGSINIGQIEQSYSNTEINGSITGGLIGYSNNNSTIKNSFAAGKLNGYGIFQGLIGLSSSNVTIDKCYSITAFNQKDTISNDPTQEQYYCGSKIENSYYDSLFVTGKSILPCDTNYNMNNALELTAINTADFANGTTFTDWDFNTVWTIGVQLNIDQNPRPYLRWMDTSITELNQFINLTTGWNLVSFYLSNLNNDVKTIFPNASTVKSENEFYMPNQPEFLNSLKNIEIGVGYLVNNTKTESITISGISNTYGLTQLKKGWNLVGVPIKTSVLIKDLPSEILIIKDFNSFYESGNALGTLKELTYGNAYLIQVSSDCKIEWK